MQYKIIILIVLHFLSDWILQPRAVAKRKSSSWKWMSYHLAIITATFCVVALFWNIPLYIVLLNTITHCIIDRFIWRGYARHVGEYTKEYLDKNKYAEDYWYYFTIAIDQILHLVILVLLFL